ncbi:MAG: glycosyltransferase family 9 protein [Candidatus Omnitrophica bacterium]|nr:glycosyltransferase family 9 protein [Candidatus Omnitrophota bacterium]MBU4333605.1 glycosyltransferase family 9 protein [Candidatus Omnitrophota bacterium]
MLNNKKEKKSFLVINPYGIGDVLFTTPIIRNLKDNFPDSKVYYLCNKRTEFILKNNPLIEKIFIYDRDESIALSKRSKIAWLIYFIGFICEIRREKIEVAFDFSLNTYFGFISFLSGIRDRYGLDYKKRCVFLNHKLILESFSKKHVAQYYLDLLTEFGIVPKEAGLEVYSDPKSIEWADAFVAKNDISGPIVGIAPMGGESWGSKAYLKRWPAEKFADLINKLIEDFNAKVFLFAGSNEKQEILNIKKGLEHPDQCYEFIGCSFEDVIALVDKCSLFIGNDTGLLRFADALKKKIIAFFGPVDENVYGMFPFIEARHQYMINDINCRPCYNDFRLNECGADTECLKGISVDDVIESVKKFLKNDLGAKK